MTPIGISTAIGAAALTVGRGAMGAVGDGLSFTSQLLQPDARNTQHVKESQKTAAQSALKLRTDELCQRIGRQLSAAGIQLSEPVDLIGNGQGGIAVAADHPQRTAIEAALSSDILLERDFSMLAGDYEEFVQSSRAGELQPTLTIAVPKPS